MMTSVNRKKKWSDSKIKLNKYQISEQIDGETVETMTEFIF